MKAIMLLVIILFGFLCVRNEAKNRNDKRHIAFLIAVYTLMGLVIWL